MSVVYRSERDAPAAESSRADESRSQPDAVPGTIVSVTDRRVMSVVLATVLLALLLPATAAPAAAQRGDNAGWEARQVRKGGIAPRDRDLVATLPGRAQLGYHPDTGRVRFISGTPSSPLTRAVSAVAAGRQRLSNADARGKARGFVDRFGELFGLESPARELRLRETQRRPAVPAGRVTAAAAKSTTAGSGGATVRFDQVRDGVAVMGGALVVQISADGEVLSAAGEVLPSAARTATRARISAAAARSMAATWLARRDGRSASVVSTTSEGLAI
jgi:hypothetical protein